MSTPLRATAARKVIRQKVAAGRVAVIEHALHAMADDGLDLHDDVLPVLRSGIVEEAEWENGQWRYRVHNSKIWVVVEIEDNVLIITCWEAKR